MTILLIESIILCLVFTGLVYIMSRDPIKTLYNYPLKIQGRVKTLDEYKDKIPTQKNKATAKIGACILFVIILSLGLRYVNGYTTFLQTRIRLHCQILTGDVKRCNIYFVKYKNTKRSYRICKYVKRYYIIYDM